MAANGGDGGPIPGTLARLDAGQGGGDGASASLDGSSGSCAELGGPQLGAGGGGGAGRVLVLTDPGGHDDAGGLIVPADPECQGHRRQCLL